MKVQKAIFALAVLFTFAVSTSCSKSDIAEEDALINATEEQAIDRDEVKNEDT
ncbi:hypothetical protein MTsPCn9_35100 [Croceitalea sp. MTPC9]|uniref:hypothetical protein n=1 Tax=unclassified Croceitalea TaxID=2632280 RepID=UPI002B39170A|nr:hypothetical protein MTsPCn6_35050 [Croceitalea sp. MTPC6]GMN18570.1 hypothetical protein MTsPCn9_35100 [Croceitalea sp. MTPC9]